MPKVEIARSKKSSNVIQTKIVDVRSKKINKDMRLSITSDQKEALVEFMENHFDLKKGKLSINFTTVIAKTQWEDCCKLLNSIPGPAKKWREWRKFAVRYRSSLSDQSEIQAGVPQGAIAAPLLFNIFIADQPTSTNTLVVEYADDKKQLSQLMKIHL
ncbi:hypothetical protein QTP88_013622 [Uroleucon formosanum]